MTDRPLIRIVTGGPMLVSGLSLQRLVGSHDGWSLEAALPAATSESAAGAAISICRCGRSGTMPLCDRAEPYGCFDEGGPTAPGPGPFTWDLPEPAGPPAIALKPNGPVRVAGDVTIRTGDGATLAGRDRWSLCRCGASRCQPVCDSSHKVVGYRDRSGPGP
jgi:CDGSH-type Zn-finger protein